MMSDASEKMQDRETSRLYAECITIPPSHEDVVSLVEPAHSSPSLTSNPGPSGEQFIEQTESTDNSPQPNKHKLIKFTTSSAILKSEELSHSVLKSLRLEKNIDVEIFDFTSDGHVAVSKEGSTVEIPLQSILFDLEKTNSSTSSDNEDPKWDPLKTEIISNTPSSTIKEECRSGQSTPCHTPKSSRRKRQDCGGSTRRTPRPQAMSQNITCGMIEDLPKGSGQETPITPKKRRVLKTPTELSDDDPRWDTLDKKIIVSNPPSPAVKVESGESRQSTPSQTRKSSRNKSKNYGGSQRRAGLKNLSQNITCGMIKDLCKESVQETPKTPKRRRVLKTPTELCDDDPRWDSLDKKTTSNPPSPAIKTECGGSGQSTPFKTPQSTRSEPLDSTGWTPQTPHPQERDKTSKWPTKRSLNFVPTDDGTTSSSAVTGQPARHSAIEKRCKTILPSRPSVNDEDISSSLCFFGSESEPSDDEGDKEGLIPVRIPRAAQMFFGDIDEVATSVAEVDLQWPPSTRLTVHEPSAVPPPQKADVMVVTPSHLLSPSPPRTSSPTNHLSSSPPLPSSPTNHLSSSPPLPSSPTNPLSSSPIRSSSPSSETLPSPPGPSSPTLAAKLEDVEVPYGPINKFDFNWQTFPEPPVPPKLRREPFNSVTCGPTAAYDTPYDAFTAMWDKEIMTKIANETNDYAQVLARIMIKENTMSPFSRINKWQDTDPDELYRFFGLILAMGVVCKSRIEEYWNSSLDIFSTPQFSAIMSIDRFYLLCKCLHFSPVRIRGQEAMTNAEAKLFKVKPIIDHLNIKFSTLYNLGQNIALDESLTMWKGWLEINQFIDNKKASVGIKTYEVCESQTGYLWRFEVHAGHEPPVTEGPLSGTIPTLVLRLLNGLEHRGHTVWMDNFYNSPALARELKSLGFDCVGTLRTDRQLVPTELATLTKQQMVPDQVVGCTSGDVDLVVWMDKNRVALISTYHGLATTMCGDTTKPTVVHDYNICMGGVDKKDQMLAMYPIERKRTRIWYKKFFKRLLNVSVLNAYILYRENHNTTRHREFRKTLIKQIIEMHPKVPLPQKPLHNMHIPMKYDFIPRELGKKPERHRARCRVCKKRVSSYCQGCDVPLCAFKCFSIFVHK